MNQTVEHITRFLINTLFWRIRTLPLLLAWPLSKTIKSLNLCTDPLAEYRRVHVSAEIFSPTLWNLQFYVPLSLSIVYSETSKGPWNNCTTCQMMQLHRNGKGEKKKIGLGFYVASNLEIDGKKEITAECREEKATHVEREWGESGVCFAGFTRSECLHLPKTVWDNCMWVLVFFPWPRRCENEECFRAVWQWEGVAPVCCGALFAARLLLRYLIRKNKQPWGTLNFHKTITAFLNPSTPSGSNQRRRETDRRTAKKKKKGDR